MMTFSTAVPAVYGPVRSWRFGQSLGVDVIGDISTCSYNCLYCQLGSISDITCDRAVFVPTAQIQQELQCQTWSAVDVVTLSGSGEPTLALNLGEVITAVHSFTNCPVVVLTNGTLLGDRGVRQDLATADTVAIKLDAVSSDRWKAVNRSAPGLHLDMILQGIITFREQFPGHVAIQTMVMEPWSTTEEQRYLAVLKAIQPEEVQLNTPLRPRPLHHQLEARGNEAQPDHTWRQPRHVTPQTLSAMSDRLQAQLDIPVKHPYQDARVHARVG